MLLDELLQQGHLLRAGLSAQGPQPLDQLLDPVHLPLEIGPQASEQGQVLRPEARPGGWRPPAPGPDLAPRSWLPLRAECFQAPFPLGLRLDALVFGPEELNVEARLEESRPLLDAERDPALITNSSQLLALSLADSGEYRRAGELLLESGLQEAFTDQPLNLLRLRWVDAKIHAGMDRFDRAAAVFEEIRTGFLARGLHYDAALAGLDLAVVWLHQGRTERLLPLILQTCVSFRRLDLPTPEAYVAMTFLKHACKLGAASVRAVERTRDFLFRCQADPELKFDAKSVYG